MVDLEGKRYVFQILETVRDPHDLGYIPCIAIEGERGYYKTDWNWGTDLELARRLCDQRNEDMGIDKKTAFSIVIGTMGNLSV